MMTNSLRNFVRGMTGSEYWKKKRRGQGKDSHLDGKAVPTAQQSHSGRVHEEARRFIWGHYRRAPIGTIEGLPIAFSKELIGFQVEQSQPTTIYLLAWIWESFSRSSTYSLCSSETEHILALSF
jgi:hypothetical protein